MGVRGIERVLFAVGVGLLAFYGLARVDSITASKSALRRFTASKIAIQERTSKTNSRSRAAPTKEFALWSPQRIRAYEDSLLSDTRTPIAVLFIPKVQLRAPVFDNTDALTLNRGVGHIAGTARLGGFGNIAIAGHRDGFFRGLKDIEPGDEIDLEVPTRNDIHNDVYFVRTIQIVAPADVSVLRAHAAPALTLVTCYPFYYFGDAPQRYVVTAFRKPKGELQ